MASRINGHEFEQPSRNGEGQESLACCCSWGRKELETTVRLNTTTTNYLFGFLGGSDDKESACNAGDLGPVLASGRFPGEVNGYPL